MSKLKMGYIGCGFMAQKVHLPNIQSLAEDCELVAIAEVRPRLGRLVQTAFRIPKLYRDHRQLARNKQIQAVAVSGHVYGQGEIAIDLLQAGKDVFMEKPMAISVAQAQRILDTEKATGKRVMVAYMKRYDAGNILVKRTVEKFRKSGELGALRYIRNHGYCGDWTGGLDTPFLTTTEKYPVTPVVYPAWLPDKWVTGYLGYLQQFTHNVNLVRWFVGAKAPVAVRSVDLDLADGFRGVVVLEVGGVRTVIESGSVAYHGWDEHTQLYFDGGWIKTEAPCLLLRNVPATVEVYRGNTDDKVLAQTFPAGGRVWSYKAEMQHFIEQVKNGKPFRSRHRTRSRMFARSSTSTKPS